MKAPFLIGLTSLLAIASVPATARDRLQDGKTSDRVLESYADCLAKRGSGTGARIKEYLSVPVGNEVDEKLIKRLVVSECLTNAGRMSMAHELFARALYTAIYRKEFAANPPTDFAVASSYDGEFAPDQLPLEINQKYLRQMGDCVVAHDLAAAHEYVLAKVWTKKDEEILPEVVAAAAQCVAQGVELRFSAPMLKGIVAESLYKYRKGMTTMTQDPNL